jgi:hypothetical protein
MYVVHLHSPGHIHLHRYIHRKMRMLGRGTLTPDQTYAVTALVLYLNGILD